MNTSEIIKQASRRDSKEMTYQIPPPPVDVYPDWKGDRGPVDFGNMKPRDKS